MRDIGERADVDQLTERIARRLHEEQLGGGRDRGLPGRQIGQRHETGGHAELARVLVEQHIGRAKQALRSHDLVTRLEQTQHGGQDGCHARAGGDRALATLERGQALLEGAHGGVGEARIDVARLAAAKTGSGLGGGLEDEGRGQEHGLGVLALGGTALTCAHREGVEAGNVEGLVVLLLPLTHVLSSPPGMGGLSSRQGLSRWPDPRWWNPCPSASWPNRCARPAGRPGTCHRCRQ